MTVPFSASALETILDIDETKEILESFMEDTHGLVEIIDIAVSNHDSELLRRNSHKLRGCCRAINAEEGQAIGADLEACALGCDWSRAQALISQLKLTYKAITQAIGCYLNSK